MSLNQNANANQNAQKQNSPTNEEAVGHFVDLPPAATVGYETVTRNQPYYNIEEKIAQLSLQLNQVVVKPYLQQALDYLKSSKLDAINSYNQLSDQVASEIKIICQNIQIVNLKLKEVETNINKYQEIIRNKYANATEEEISTGQLDLTYEYNIVAEYYEATLQLSQEISNYKSRVISLNNLQALLDKSMIPFVSRLQVEIDNLELLVHNFDSSEYADILAKKRGISSGSKLSSTSKFVGRTEELNKLTEEFNNEVQNTPKIQEFKRVEDTNQQKINTFNNTTTNSNTTTNNVETQTVQTVQTVQEEPVRKQSNSFTQKTFTNIFKPSQKTQVNEQTNTEQVIVRHQYDDRAMYDEQVSRQEQKLMRKLRQQQLQMEHTMKMNQMIHEYNKSVDEMMRAQRKYEEQFREEQRIEEESRPKTVYETEAKIETLREHVDKVQNDRLFVVRNTDKISEEEAKQISKKFGTKSIRVVK